jgi:type I restriction enzyme R subunit
MTDESERKTRRQRIDPKLDAAGWLLRGRAARRTEEEETSNGPADYALWLDKKIVGVVEAKKVTLGPQNVLTQAERYARGLRKESFDFEGLRCPFLYSTNGEVIWFHDVRHPLSRSRRVSRFHTPTALQELLGQDFDAASEKLLALPNGGNRLRPYQRDANAAVEKAIADRS